MVDHKVIARLLCGECEPNSRHVMGRIVDTAAGAALRAHGRRPVVNRPAGSPPTREDYDDVPIGELGDAWTSTAAPRWYVRPTHGSP